jgi:GNAT superfamily N-acetyltransferase
MQIIEINKYSRGIHDAINRLLPQLSSSATLLSESDLKEIVISPSSHLLMAVENNIYYGTLTLVVFKCPAGTRARIEDVVVRNDARGEGVGRMLINFAIDSAQQFGAVAIDLTSRPSREAANVLYKKVGFEQRATNVYRYKIT